MIRFGLIRSDGNLYYNFFDGTSTQWVITPCFARFGGTTWSAWSDGSSWIRG